MNERLSTTLDLSRWIAAFLVIVGHVAHLFLVGRDGLIERTILVETAYFITNLGHTAVMIFFVISGFLVGGITLDRWMSKGPDVTGYAVSRFARIYTVLLPALAFGYVLDSIGVRWLDGAGLYSNVGQLPIGSLDQVGVRLSPLVFIGNVLMLQGAYVTSLGSNGPLWSLAYEWWYYCILCFAAAGALLGGWLRAIGIGLILLLAIVFPVAMFLWMLIWWFGVAAYFLMRSKIPPPKTWFAATCFGLSVVGSYLFETHVHGAPIFLRFTVDAAVAAAYTLVLWSVSRADASIPFARFHKWAAGFSYTMYLVHFPIFLFLGAAASQFLGWPILSSPSWAAWGRIIVMICALYTIGYLFYLVTEKHTDRVRAVLKRGALKLAPTPLRAD